MTFLLELWDVDYVGEKVSFFLDIRNFNGRKKREKRKNNQMEKPTDSFPYTYLLLSMSNVLVPGIFYRYSYFP